METREQIIQAVRQHAIGHIEKHKMNVEIYLKQSVGIGEHGDILETIEKELGQKALKIFLPMQPGDVKASLADTSLLENWIDYKPSTTLKDGINKFVKWYKSFYKEF